MNGHIRGGVKLAVLGIVAGLVLSVALAGPATAQEATEDGEDHVVLTGGLQVGEGETVRTAVVFNGPVVIEGTVTETLVVFNGRTTISGSVSEDVIVFRGRVAIASGAEVGGDVVTSSEPQVAEGATVRGDLQDVTTRFDLEDTFGGRMAVWIAYSVSALILGLLLLLLAPRIDGAIATTARSRLGASIGLGVAAFFLLPIAAILLLVTIVGIPLGVFLLLALALLYTVGYVIASHAVGRFILKAPKSRFLAFLVGLGILRLLALVPVVGGLSWILATMFGLGLLIVSARRKPSTLAAPGVSPTPAVAAG